MIDFSKCICENSGFCSLYNKVMESEPPNWQWCKEATEKEREQHYAQTKNKKKNYRSHIKPPSTKLSFANYPRFIKSSDLIKVCLDSIIPKLKNIKVSGVVGIPRSGVFPASIISLHLNVPLYSISDGEIIRLNSVSKYGGFRMSEHKECSGNLLFIDDTICSGRTFKSLNIDAIKVAVYCHPQSIDMVDLYGEILELPHFLEWNFFKLPHISNYGIFDMDGVLCPNVPVDMAKNHHSYIDYINNVEPILKNVPQHEINIIATGRLEKYRDDTEKWLEKNNVKYRELIMFPSELKPFRDTNHVKAVGEYKAKIFNENKECKFFIESCPKESAIIKKQNAHKYVICTNGCDDYSLINIDGQRHMPLKLNENTTYKPEKQKYYNPTNKNPIINTNCV